MSKDELFRQVQVLVKLRELEQAAKVAVDASPLFELIRREETDRNERFLLPREFWSAFWDEAERRNLKLPQWHPRVRPKGQ